MEANVYDKIHEVELKETMEQSYVDYAMSVIVSRALPDVRDGLKPVQRRVLFSMDELNNTPDKPHRKCARIVGDTMGKYHPHGDSSIYGSLVYMAQTWNEHYPLVDGHGNFGSVDGDGAAAMRYTEARLSKISMELLADLYKDTVDFVPNFDETEKEPTVLPARFPNLLVNGAQGIAVGMATNIPPHNLRETIEAIVKIIDNRVNENRDTSIDEIMQCIKGPDFPTGAVIIGKNGINQAYRTGRGKIRVRSVYTIEPMDNGKNRIVITEIPYLVNKARLIEKIADLHKEKKVDGMTDIRDESSNREGTGTRIVIELRRDVNPNVIMNQLLKHTQLEDTFGVIMLALANGEPKVMNLLEMLKYYIKHQEDVVTRRSVFDLAKAKKRAHIIEGLLIALDNIDEVIRIVRSAATVQEAKVQLCERFGLSDEQAQAIVDMRIRALTGLEREKLEDEYNELKKTILFLEGILADENKLLGVIRDEIQLISDKYGDDRKTQINLNEETEILDADLIPVEDNVVAMTKMGYIKRMHIDNFKAQNRGGKGIKGMQVLNEDYTTSLEMTSSHDNIMFFTNKGRVYYRKVFEIPEAGRTSRGVPVINLIPLMPEEKVTSIITQKELDLEGYIFMCTKKGIIKKTPASEFKNVRKTGIIALLLREDDELVNAKDTKGSERILLSSKKGKTIFFNETDVRASGRSSFGVKGINLSKEDEVVSMEIEDSEKTVLFVSEKGLGKRTEFKDFSLQQRGGKGCIGYRINDRSGEIVGTCTLYGEEEIMLISTDGIIIRTPVHDIPVIGRATSGVKLMNIQKDSGIKVASFTVIEKSDYEEEGSSEESAEISESMETGSEESDYSATEEGNSSEE